ncbi:hypothetical protein, variant [Puccinia triticina 1-1 BBBD Race 1]|uniref:DUF962 domain protein n=2 Tax=Puccinia triticina TaxID=208348 RepID=A0A0C4EY84_PUCT1|nr:uncharacterized protein PtA15_6A796 [Puccinia triticina]OAV97094.1 hypothetical protein, variant [Puccinia triticina 1-1 BBBD Race 1]WAQ86164.1 hypothetical protein PtA15_6A796 [Puccinia triticina]
MSSTREQQSKTAIDQDTPLLPTTKSYSIFNLEDQFLFYGQYHHNPVNILIHLICVPVIFFTSLILAHQFGFFPHTVLGAVELPELLVRTGWFGQTGAMYELNMSTVTSIGYALYFVALEPVAGLLYMPILLAFGHWANLIVTSFPDSYFNPTLAIWVLSWILQFVGHGHFEKRKPALIDNLFQSIVLAVFFVWIEALFFLGYKPALARSIHRKIAAAVAQFKASSPSHSPQSPPPSKAP